MSKECFLLASTRPLFARTLGKLVQSERPACELLEAESLPATLATLAASRIDVLLLDASVALVPSLAETLGAVTKVCGRVSVVLVLDENDDQLCNEAMRLGAAGVLLKASPPGVIATSLAMVLSGQLCRPAPVLAHDVELPAIMREHLSERDQQLLKALMRGESITSAARLMDITPQKTVQEVQRILAIVKGRLPANPNRDMTLH